MKPKKIVLNKIDIVGMCILEISKLRMYDFHYKFMKKVYGNRAKILYMDTDSFLYEIKKSENFNDVMNKHRRLFDTSNFDRMSSTYSNVNQSVCGKMKRELPNKIISEYVGLRAKEYCLKIEQSPETKKAKGIPQCVMKGIKFEDYLSALFDTSGEKKTCQYHTIRSKNHTIHTYAEKKILLNPWDDKRYISENGYDTMPYYHKDTRCCVCYDDITLTSV